MKSVIEKILLFSLDVLLKYFTKKYNQDSHIETLKLIQKDKR